MTDEADVVLWIGALLVALGVGIALAGWWV